jgi:ubiquinone/menaquinone biosynthesis C-methylase UbiE
MTFDGTLYAANTAHHRAHDAEVLADVPLAAGTRVLDLGCGSGDFTAALVPAVAPGGRVVGVDVSPSQVEHARAHHPGAEFLVGRAQDVGGLFPPASFDVVVSVATLHWVPDADQPSVITGLAAVLPRGGVLRVDMGGAGQIEAARQVLDGVSASFGGPASPWYFPTAQGYRARLEAAGFGVRRAGLVRQRRSFPDAVAFEGWLRSQILPAYLPGIAPDRRDGFAAAALATGLERLRREDGSYDQDYVRLDVLAER